MSKACKILGTVLAFCAAIPALKFGFIGLFALKNACDASLPALPCKLVYAASAGLLAFACIVIPMMFTNRIWGRNVFQKYVR